MHDIAWRAAFTFLVLTAVTLLGSNASCSPANRLIERALGQTPQTQVAHYLEAVAEGDGEAALALWPVSSSSSQHLQLRRKAVTAQLSAYGAHLEHQILDVEWWTTCCDPAIVDDPDQAGGARVHVAVSSRNGPRAVYIFDVLVPGGYWGDAAGNPVRHWAIVDVYPQGAAPLAWPVR